MSPTAEALLWFIEVCKYLFMNSSPKVSLDFDSDISASGFFCFSATLLYISYCVEITALF